MATKESKDKETKVEEEKPTRAGIPKDWVAPAMQISADIKFCDMKVETR